MKTKKNLRILALFSLLLLSSASITAAAPTDLSTAQRLSPPDGSFPLILKSDINNPYKIEKGFIGNPIYESNKSGDLAGVFIPTLQTDPEQANGKELWKGEVYRLKYKETDGMLETIEGWNLRKKLADQFQKSPNGRRSLMWFGFGQTYANGTASPYPMHLAERSNPNVIKDAIGVDSYKNNINNARISEDPLVFNGIDKWMAASLPGHPKNGYSNNVPKVTTGVGADQKRMYALSTSGRTDDDFAVPAPFFGLNDIINWRECTHPSFDKVLDIVGEARSYDIHPTKLLTGWLLGVDYKPNPARTYKVQHPRPGTDNDASTNHIHEYIEVLYKDGKTDSKSAMRELLPDLGKGSIALVGRAYDVVATSQQGYNSYVEKLNDEHPPMLYFQTNDGVVRAINVEGKKSFTWYNKDNKTTNTANLAGWGKHIDVEYIQPGNENMAFIPPNVLYRKRLAQQKLEMKIDGGKLFASRWREDTPPAFLTDGDLIVHNLQAGTGSAGINYEGQAPSANRNPNGGNGWEWQTFITGMMGRGGAGMYTMARNTYTYQYNNTLSWAVENNLYSFRPGNPVGETIYWTPHPKNATHGGYSLANPKVLKRHPNSPELVSKDIVSYRPWNQKDYPGIHHGRRLEYKTNPSGNADYGDGKPYDPKYFLMDGEDLDGAWNYWRFGWNAPRPAFGTMEVAKSYARNDFYGLTEPGKIDNVSADEAGDPYNPDLVDRVSSNLLIDKKVAIGSGRAFQLAIIPGGQQYYTDLSKNGTIGAAIYVSAAENGHILNVFTAYNRNNSDDIAIENVDIDNKVAFDGRPDPVMGMITTPVIAVARDKRNKDSTKKADRFLRSAFTADNRGNIFEIPFTIERGNGKCDLYDTPWDKRLKARRVATLMPDSGKKPDWLDSPKNEDCYIIPYRLAIAIEGNAEVMSNDLWICGGTANLPTVKVPGSPHEGKPLENKKQFIFGFNRPPHGVDIKDSNPGHNKMSITSHGVQMHTNSKQPATYSHDQKKAWYIMLGEEDPDEYVSSTPLMYSGQLYVTTYLPKLEETHYYVLDPTSGKSYLSGGGGKRYYTLKGIQVKGIAPVRVGGKMRIALAYNGHLSDRAASEAGGDKMMADDGLDDSSNIVTVSTSTGNEVMFKNHRNYLYYWNRKNF